MKKLFFVMAVSFVGIANATVWNPAANWIFPPDAGDWGNTANWTDGVPMADSDAAFVVPGAADCHVTTPDAVCGVLLQGDNGPGGVLRIMDGGSLTTGSNWSARDAPPPRWISSPSKTV